MSPDNQTELDNIHTINQKHINKKFRKGVEQHGGLLADMSNEQLIKELLNEIDDLYVYVGEARLRGLL